MPPANASALILPHGGKGRRSRCKVFPGRDSQTAHSARERPAREATVAKGARPERSGPGADEAPTYRIGPGSRKGPILRLPILRPSRGPYHERYGPREGPEPCNFPIVVLARLPGAPRSGRAGPGVHGRCKASRGRRGVKLWPGACGPRPTGVKSDPLPGSESPV